MRNLFKNKYINKLCITIINITIPFPSLRRHYRKMLKHYLIQNDISQKYPDYYQFVMFPCWGDFYMPCVLFEEFKKQNPDAKILAICQNDNQAEVLKKISAIDDILIISSDDYSSLLALPVHRSYSQKLKKGRLYILSHWHFNKADKNKSMNFFELYTKMLGLKYPSVPCIPKGDCKRYEKYKNTILIYPESNSFSNLELSDEFWMSLADKFIQLGNDVIFNTDSNKYKNYKTIFLPMQEQIMMAKACKLVIGIRCGLSDILALNEVKKHIVIYPKNIYFRTITKQQQKKEFSRAFVMEKDKTFRQNMYRLTSLKMFNDCASEIVFNDNYDDFVDEIISLAYKISE